ncbi:hypothetical protein ACFQ4C_29895 [Larkinella insperata]|uniref:Uncharacterized protein n=1 Tax=Larkinella insperata TaxID=332158 RepID=A0ABW3QGT9_9BACT
MATTNLKDILAELEDYIKNTARQYAQACERARRLLAGLDKQEAVKLVAGTPGYVYLKQKGHKSLATEDIQQIINELGSEEEKRIVADFPAAQQALTDRLKETPSIGLVMKQAKVSYQQYYQRQLRPDLWSAEQMIAIVDVLDRLQI